MAVAGKGRSMPLPKPDREGRARSSLVVRATSSAVQRSDGDVRPVACLASASILQGPTHCRANGAGSRGQGVAVMRIDARQALDMYARARKNEDQGVAAYASPSHLAPFRVSSSEETVEEIATTATTTLHEQAQNPPEDVNGGPKKRQCQLKRTRLGPFAAPTLTLEPRSMRDLSFPSSLSSL
jgi:hypothetical protein